MSPGIDFQPGGPELQLYLTYQPARDTSAGGIDSLESIPGLLKRLQILSQATLAVGIDSWAPETFTNSGSGYIGCRNRFLGSLNVYKFGLRLHWLSESIPGPLKHLQIRALLVL